jgi:hypothetical protein
VDRIAISLGNNAPHFGDNFLDSPTIIPTMLLSKIAIRNNYKFCQKEFRLMKLLRSVTWEDQVLPCWRRNANNAPRPNSDIWRPLPPGIDWHQAELTSVDVQSIYLLGSSDFHDTFGTYKIAEIRTPFPSTSSDRHHTLPLAMKRTLEIGGTLDSPILIAESTASNMVVIDGNHRILAHLLNNSLAGLSIFVGIQSGIHRRFSWSHPARI